MYIKRIINNNKVKAYHSQDWIREWLVWESLAATKAKNKTKDNNNNKIIKGCEVVILRDY